MRTPINVVSLILGLSLLGYISLPGSAEATEGGRSIFAPGVFGNFVMGHVPGPGFYFNDLAYWYSGTATSKKTLVNGRLQVNASVTQYTNDFGFTGVSEWKLAGGNYWASVHIPVSSATLNAGATLNAFGETISRNVSGSQFGMGDWYVVPFGLAWDHGNYHFDLFEGVNVPIGEYNVNDLVSIGHNYWAFDTNVGMNYRDEKTGFTFAADLGYIINTMNPATNYLSGQELHLDVMVGQHLSQTLAVGLVGYGFWQTTGDSGSGDTVGPFQGTAYGIGPAVQGIVMAGKTPIVLELQWIAQFGVVNQFSGNYVQFNLAFQF